ncbi:hypothetical protein NHH03_08230 [Stieleria sp. TO1_6]|nr:hypothetical protein [Stieleria tagensis]
MAQQYELRGARRWFQFSLRFLLVVAMIASSFCAGWMSHRSWSRQHLEQTIQDAFQDFGEQAQIEQINEGDLIRTHNKAAADKIQTILERVETAAGR